MNAIVALMFDPALLAPERVRPLKRREYEKLVDLGVFGDERVELLRGVLVEMSPQGNKHSGITAWFAMALARATTERYEVRSHSPFAASSDSMPEPDVSVSRPRADGKHPRSQDALLLIEVSGSSIVKDRTIKTEIYAAAGVPEYWIVNTKNRTIDVLRQPSKTGYKRVVRREIDSVIRPLKVRGVSIRVADVPWFIEDDERPAKKRARKRR
ncbi:MAG TPA: Uma2 family endonuclease [Kofleriaceae bacterium]|jgi:Uma2 family endonuclease